MVIGIFHDQIFTNGTQARIKCPGRYTRWKEKENIRQDVLEEDGLLSLLLLSKCTNGTKGNAIYSFM